MQREITMGKYVPAVPGGPSQLVLTVTVDRRFGHDRTYASLVLRSDRGALSMNRRLTPLHGLGACPEPPVGVDPNLFVLEWAVARLLESGASSR